MTKPASNVVYEIPKVPETLLKRRRKAAEWKVKDALDAKKRQEKRNKNQKNIFKRAEQYAAEYEKEKKDLVVMKRNAKKDGNFYVPDEANLAFVIRIRGINGLHPKVRKILRLFRLLQINNGVFIRLNKATSKMLKLVEPYIAFGYPNLNSVRKLIYKRGFAKVNGQRIPITDNSIVDDKLGKSDIICVEDLVHEIFKVGPQFKAASNFLWPFKLNNPQGGWTKKTNHYVEGGDYGNREDEINKLINRMNLYSINQISSNIEIQGKYSDRELFVSYIRHQSSSLEKKMLMIGNKINEYYLLKVLGGGNFGDVYLAEHEKTKKKVCCKKIRSPDSTSEREFRIHSQLQHDNIIATLLLTKVKGELFLFLEYCEGGDLADFLKKNTMTSQNIVTWLYELLSALDYIHKKKIMHRDIKPQNIMIKNEHPKLGDFGVSKFIINETCHTIVGTYKYMSPEVFRSETRYNYKTDIWSLGLVLYEMCEGQAVMNAKELPKLIKLILEQPIPNITGSDAYRSNLDVIYHKMCQRETSRRPSAEALLRSKFLIKFRDKVLPQQSRMRSAKSSFIKHAKNEEQIRLHLNINPAVSNLTPKQLLEAKRKNKLKKKEAAIRLATEKNYIEQHHTRNEIKDRFNQTNTTIGVTYRKYERTITPKTVNSNVTDGTILQSLVIKHDEEPSLSKSMPSNQTKKWRDRQPEYSLDDDHVGIDEEKDVDDDYYDDDGTLLNTITPTVFDNRPIQPMRMVGRSYADNIDERFENGMPKGERDANDYYAMYQSEEFSRTVVPNEKLSSSSSCSSSESSDDDDEGEVDEDVRRNNECENEVDNSINFYTRQCHKELEEALTDNENFRKINDLANTVIRDRKPMTKDDICNTFGVSAAIGEFFHRISMNNNQ
ncbi:hypothetical protein SNEBB_002960 [Seison nebaliae]|nr:hypothetical protein SNEBB_002960 [Seison nebaliae]